MQDDKSFWYKGEQSSKTNKKSNHPNFIIQLCMSSFYDISEVRW